MRNSSPAPATPHLPPLPEARRAARSAAEAGRWPELMGTADAAAYCGFRLAAWRKLDSSGRSPMPLKVGRLLMWRRGDLDAWINAGCPARDADAAEAYRVAVRRDLAGLGRR